MIINISDYRGVDPILRKGDEVRIIAEYEIEVDDFGFGSQEYDLIDLQDRRGIVISVDCMYLDTDNFPGQAEYITVAIPFEDGWETFPEIHISNVRRILSKEFNAIRNLV